MSVNEQEVALVRTLAIAVGEDYAVVIGQYFDAIHQSEVKSIVITDQMFTDCFMIEDCVIPQYKKWSGKIEIKDDFVLSIQAGGGMMSTPRVFLDRPQDYEGYEIAILNNSQGLFVNLNEIDSSINTTMGQVSGYLSVEKILEIGNKFIRMLNDGWEVQYA